MDLTVYYSLWFTACALFSVSTIASMPSDTSTKPKSPNYPPFGTCPINVSEIPLTQYIIPYDDDSPRCAPMPPRTAVPVYPYDKPPFHFALNIEFTEAEWFLYGSLGIGLDQIAPELAHGGPPPIDGRKANLDEVTQKIITEFAYQEVGHIRFCFYFSLLCILLSCVITKPMYCQVANSYLIWLHIWLRERSNPY